MINKIKIKIINNSKIIIVININENNYVKYVILLMIWYYCE